MNLSLALIAHSFRKNIGTQTSCDSVQLKQADAALPIQIRDSGATQFAALMKVNQQDETDATVRGLLGEAQDLARVGDPAFTEKLASAKSHRGSTVDVDLVATGIRRVGHRAVVHTALRKAKQQAKAGQNFTQQIAIAKEHNEGAKAIGLDLTKRIAGAAAQCQKFAARTAEPLATINKNTLNTGLRGIPVGTCRTSSVDAETGVSYVGYPVQELASHDPEAIAYLMLHKTLPDAEELSAFSADLKKRAKVEPEIIASLANMPRDTHPMSFLSIGLTLLSKTRTGDWEEDGRNLIARAPELIAAMYRIRHGQEPISPDPDLGLMENFVHMLGVTEENKEKLTRVLRAFYVLHMDHGGGNLSTFIGKGVASGHADVFTSLSGAMGALSGPLHGGANQKCLELLQRANEVAGTSPEKIEQFVRDELAAGGKIFGFGHAVLRAEDTRAAVLYDLGKEVCPDDPIYQTSVAMRSAATKVLKENPKISNPYPNVDAVSGAVLNGCGLADPDFFTVLFGLSRITGITAQILDERLHMRDGKGVPIMRPKYLPENQPKR